MNIDKLADNPRQINRSPFAYAWDNPIYNSDPDGNCPQCISGALISILTEVTMQVGSSMLVDGLSVQESLEVLEYDKILIEGATGALSGALDGGAAKFAKFLSKKKNREVLTKILSVALDAVINMVNSAAKNISGGKEDIISKQDIFNSLIDAGFGKLVDELLPEVSSKNIDKKIKKTEKKLNKKSKKSKRKKLKKKLKKLKEEKSIVKTHNKFQKVGKIIFNKAQGKIKDEIQKEENK